MNKEEGRREIVFQMTMTVAKEMLEKGQITRQQYTEFNTKMKQKYKPIFGSLLFDLSLM
ncbi:MAG: hypothetical protein K6E91_03855 [Butyrivibrio sp.]|nr:hypothetical protein [Butyrivibrio sp.]